MQGPSELQWPLLANHQDCQEDTRAAEKPVIRLYTDRRRSVVSPSGPYRRWLGIRRCSLGALR
jgi:hypothetical protein